MIPSGKELASCPGRNGGDDEMEHGSPLEFGAGIGAKKEKSGTPKRAAQTATD